MYGGLAFFIGGGPPMATAMVWTIVCDVVPANERTPIFYQIVALVIVLNALVNPLAAWLLSIDAWLPLWIGFACMVLSNISSLFIPETLQFREKADAKHHNRSNYAGDALPSEDEDSPANCKFSLKTSVQVCFHSARDNAMHIWRFILGSKSVMLLVLAYGLYSPVRSVFESGMLQYTTKRFNWSWSKVSSIVNSSREASHDANLPRQHTTIRFRSSAQSWCFWSSFPFSGNCTHGDMERIPCEGISGSPGDQSSSLFSAAFSPPLRIRHPFSLWPSSLTAWGPASSPKSALWLPGWSSRTPWRRSTP